MSREIKFRAWHKTEQHWIENFMSLPLFAGLDVMFQRVSDIEIMQFTGLKDKHGHDVYEGDIVQAVQTIFPNAGETDRRVVTIETEYPHCIMPFGQCVGYDGELWVDELIDGFEIVGNVWENREMVEKEQ